MDTGNLEHKIKEAFEANDARATFQGKEKMWGRLEASMGHTYGVSAFWRIAAVFLLLISTAVIFAVTNKKAGLQQEIEKIMLQNKLMQTKIDSLTNLPVTIKTEPIVLEKIVYRDRQPVQTKPENEDYWKEKFQSLSDSVENIIASREKLLKEENEKMKNDLASLNDELETYRLKQINDVQKKSNEPFQLKAEKIEPQTQDNMPAKSKDLEIKLFQKNFINNPNNLNRTILNK